MPLDLSPESLPWYRSKIIVGSIVSILATVAGATGIVGQISAADQQTIVDAIVTGVGLVGSLAALVARLTQKHAPPIAGK